jgi:hypothetical protein
LRLTLQAAQLIINFSDSIAVLTKKSSATVDSDEENNRI